MTDWHGASGVHSTVPVTDFFVPRLTEVEGLGDQRLLFVRTFVHDIIILDCLTAEPRGARMKTSIRTNVPDPFSTVARLSRTGGADIVVPEGFLKVVFASC